jgi:hypothetical protein
MESFCRLILGNRMKENGLSFRQGMPESSAMDGNVPNVQVHDLGNAVGRRLSSLDDGFRHPCRNDGAFCLSDDLYCLIRLPCRVIRDSRGSKTRIPLRFIRATLLNLMAVMPEHGDEPTPAKRRLLRTGHEKGAGVDRRSFACPPGLRRLQMLVRCLGLV